MLPPPATAHSQSTNIFGRNKFPVLPAYEESPGYRVPYSLKLLYVRRWPQQSNAFNHQQQQQSSNSVNLQQQKRNAINRQQLQKSTGNAVNRQQQKSNVVNRQKNTGTLLIAINKKVP